MKLLFTKFLVIFFVIAGYSTDDELVITSSNADFNCRNDLTTLSVGSYVSYLWNTGAITPSITVNTPGYFWVTVVDEDGCSSTSNKFRLSGTGNGSMLAIIRTMGNIELCPGRSVTVYGNENLRYEWSNGDTINYLMINEAANLSLTLIDSVGCRSLPSDTLNITVFDPPKPTINIEGPTDFCNETDGTILTATYDTGLDFRWNTLDTNPVIEIIDPGTYYGIISNDTGCEILSTPVFISPINTTVPAILASSDFTLCPGETLTLTAYFDSYEYEWSNGATAKSVDFTEGGFYTLNLIDEDGCRSVTGPIEIEAPDIYVPDIFSNGPTTFCEGSAVILKADVDPDHFWQWQNGSQAIDTVVSDSGMFYISSLDFDSGCRVYSDTVNVIVGKIEKPVIEFDTDTILCKGDSIVLYSKPSAGYFWSGPDATELNRRDSVLVVKNGGVYDLAHINDIGCVSSSEPVNIIVDTLSSKPHITGDYNFELNVFFDYTTNAAPSTKILWESTGGVINLPEEDTITVVWRAIENADLCVTHTSAFGCIQEKVCVSDIITTVNEVYLDNIMLSPNPCKDLFKISGIEPAVITAIKIYSSNGALLDIKQANSSNTYNLKELSEGLFFVELVTGGQSYLKKLYKQ